MQQFKFDIQKTYKMQYSQVITGAQISKFAPDSSFFVYSETTKVHIKQCSLQLKNMIDHISTPFPISQIQISSNSKYIAVFMSKKCLIHVYKVEDGSLSCKIQDSQAGIVSFFWVANSMQLMVFSQFMYKVSIYNLQLGNMCYIKTPKFHSMQGFSFTSDGIFMALLQRHECKDYLTVYYTKDWKAVNTFPLDLFDAVEVKWSPNNFFLVVWDNCINYRLIVLGHMYGQMLRYEPYNFALGIKSVKFSNNSKFLAIGSFDEKIRILNATTWHEIGELDCSNPVINCQKTTVLKQEDPNKTTNRLKIFEQKFFKITSVKPTFNADKNTTNQGIGILQFSEDDNYVACRNDNMPYTVWIWEMSTLELITIISCANQIKSFKWTKKQNFLCIINGTDRILFWKQKGTVAECIFNFNHKKISIQKIKWNNDGTKAIIMDKNDFVYAEVIPDTLEKSNY